MGGELAGFAIDRVQFDRDNDNRLVLYAWSEGSRFDESVILQPRDRDCDDGRWRFTTRWNALVLDGVVAGLFWTGGIFLPAAERDEYTLAFTEDGELAVHYVGRLTGTFFLVFPMYIKGEQVWFVYDRVESGDQSGEGNR